MDKSVAVIGVGTMGQGIAQVAAQSGWKVTLYDALKDAAANGREKIAQLLQQRVEKSKLTLEERDGILDRLRVAATLEETVREVDLVIEAALEDLQAKRELFRSIAKSAPRHAILATNTSSLSITAIGASTLHPENVVGMHFFNPAPVMKLVEVIRGDRTSEETIKTVVAIAHEWGKIPAVAKDTPGFIVNRVARSFYGEALRMLGENLAGVETIDRIMTGVGGFRMGPFQLMDLVGVDVNLMVTKSVYHAFCEEPRFRPHSIQQKMVDAGLLGRKSRRGFYTYGD